jgi:hypothetical protein
MPHTLSDLLHGCDRTVAAALGLGAYLAFAGDVLIWLLEAILVVALVRLIWRRARARWR